jgi:hypothetical protein
VAEQAKEHTRIEATVEECFGTLTDFESYPEWAGDLKEAKIVERDDDGRALVVEFRAAAMGRSTTYRLRYDYSEAPNRLGWHLDTGDIQRELDGAYELRAADGDEGATDVSYELSIDLIMPIPGFVKRRAEARILKTALDELKHRVEHALTPRSDGSDPAGSG